MEVLLKKLYIILKVPGWLINHPVKINNRDQKYKAEGKFGLRL